MPSKLTYKGPYKVAHTTLSNAMYLNERSRMHYERSVIIESKHGMVMVYDFNWENNHGVDNWTQFETIHQGYKYIAYIERSRLKDQQIKWLATHFIKQIISLKSKAQENG